MAVRALFASPLLLFVGCRGCRVAPPGCGMDAEEVVLGAVPVGGSLRVALPVGGRVVALDEVGLSAEGFDTDLDEERLAVILSWAPTEEGDAWACLDLPGAEALYVSATTAAAVPDELDPVAVGMGYEPLDSLPETGLGDAAMDAGPIPIAVDEVSGNAFFGDGTSGVAWRLDQFYNHARMGLWVAGNRDTADVWDPAPHCFLDTKGLEQDGTCDGSERNAADEIPRGWSYFHGGFAGQGELVGIGDLVADPVRRRVWALADGTLWAIDTDLYTTEDEGDDTYAFTQLLPFRVELGDDWGNARGGLRDDVLHVFSLDSGELMGLRLPEGETGLPESQPQSQGVFEPGLEAAFGDGLLFVARDGEIEAIDLLTGKSAWTAAVPGDLVRGAPAAADAEAATAWFAWGDVVVVAHEGEAHAILPPREGTITGVVSDRVGGGEARALDMIYIVAQDDAGTGWLGAATWDGAWMGELVDLPAPPVALGHGRAAHDLYVVYGAGSQLCALEDPGVDLDEVCLSGGHPPTVQPMFNPYGLVPPASGGHPLNLFLSPILETPKDEDVDTAYASGAVCGSDPQPGCCSLRWSVDERLIPNAAYFEETLVPLGVQLAWGVNPSLIRQARTCLDSPFADHVQAGRDALLAIVDLVGDSSEITAWNHTGPNGTEVEEKHRFFMGLVGVEGIDFVLPIDTQEEYELLHQGLAASFDLTGIEGFEDVDLWTPMASGNALDAESIYDPETGWEGAGWVVPVRDGPIPTWGEPRTGYYFLSAGADLSLGTSTYRKKELWPIDLRERAALSWLNEDIERPDRPDPASGLVNLPGMSWELGTLTGLSDSGSYRETLKYGSLVDQRNWDYLFRYVRRLAASGRPEDVKCWYQHIFDVTNTSGLFEVNSADPNFDGDVNVASIERINAELVEPGYARWALPSEILAEWEEANPQ